MGTGVGRGILTGRLGAVVFGTAALFVLFQMVLQTFPSVMREGLVVDLSLNDAGFGGLSSSFYYPYILLQIPAGIMVARFGGAPTYAVYVLCIIIEAVLLAVPNAVNLAPMLSIGPGLPDSYRESFLGRMQRRHVRCSLLVAGLGVVAACGLVAQSPGAWTWCAFALALLTTGVLNGVRSLQQARFCSRLVFWADLLGMTVPLLVVCWSYQLGVDNLLASYFAAIAIGAGGAAWLLHRQQPEGGEVPQEVLQRCRQMGPAMAVGSLANSACSRVQPFVLQSAAGVAAVGGFGVIQTAIGPMRLLATALCSVVRPRLALHAGQVLRRKNRNGIL